VRSKTIQLARDERKAPWFEKLTALVALVDLTLVLFERTYVSWGNFYPQKLAGIIALCDLINQHFWQIDLFFCGFFSIEFLVRTFYLSRQHSHINWLEAMLWRWYDVFLLLPFWRWLGVIPVTLRLHQAGLLRLEPIHTQIKHGFSANLAGEIAEIVAIRLINSAQSAILRGEVAEWLLQPKSSTQINNAKVEAALEHRLLKLTVSRVLPKIQPDVEALLHHNIESVLEQSPLYQSLQKIPTIGQLPKEMSEHLARNLTKSLYNSLENGVADPEGGAIISQLNHHFREALHSELQEKETLQDIQIILSDLLEDLKVRYLQHSKVEDTNQTLEEVHQLRQKVENLLQSSGDYSNPI
jgi:hypothetical protein